jgi:hypothetical protein
MVMDERTLELHIDACVARLRKRYGTLPDEELLRLHSFELFAKEKEAERASARPYGSDDDKNCTHDSKRAGALKTVVERLFSKSAVIDPHIDLADDPPAVEGYGDPGREKHHYNYDPAPLWALPIPEEKIEKARSCTHCLLMSRMAGKVKIYDCPRCGFWLDTSIAPLEDGLRLWTAHVDSWDHFWSEKKKVAV